MDRTATPLIALIAQLLEANAYGIPKPSCVLKHRQISTQEALGGGNSSNTVKTQRGSALQLRAKYRRSTIRKAKREEKSFKIGISWLFPWEEWLMQFLRTTFASGQPASTLRYAMLLRLKDSTFPFLSSLKYRFTEMNRHSWCLTRIWDQVALTKSGNNTPSSKVLRWTSMPGSMSESRI